MKYLIVGCGLSGAVIARELANHGHSVTIWDRRSHIGGNMYDYVDEHGILVHKYGPHTFHTKKKALYDYMLLYGQWQPYKLWCKAEINGKATPSPFNFQTIDDYYTPEKAEAIKKAITEYYPGRESITVLEALNSPVQELREYAQFLFDNDYKLYSAKQWGVNPEEIDPSIFKRVPIRFSYRDGYFGEDEYQVMPAKGLSYVDFFKNLLDHPNITVELNKEALEHLKADKNTHKVLVDGDESFNVIYTGALDELFDNCYGTLPYRSLRFEFKYEKKDSLQDAPVVAYPQAEGFVRITEFKKLPEQDVEGTSYAVEYSLQYKQGVKQEPYYPLLTEESQNAYKKYAELADSFTNLKYCGRLGDFKYYNMDQALESALNVAKELIETSVAEKAVQPLTNKAKMQKFEFKELRLKGAYLIRPFYAPDERGGFLKDYNIDTFHVNGIEHELKEVFYTISKRGVIRATHFQLVKQQAKLVRCVSGHVYDVIVDLRPESPTFGKWEGFDLSGDNQMELYVPQYFGHGYLVIEDSVVSYKCGEVFYGEGDSGIMYNDPEIGISWPMELIGGDQNMIISEKDKKLMSFNDYKQLMGGVNR